MAIGTYLVLSLVAAAAEGIWQGCQDVWGENPLKGYRLERRVRTLSDALWEHTRDITEEELILSPEVEEMQQRFERAMIAYCLHKGVDPFEGGPAQMYWSGRKRTQERREELLNPKPPEPPVTLEQLADNLYKALHPELTALGSPAVSSAHTRAIGTSPRLVLLPSS